MTDTASPGEATAVPVARLPQIVAYALALGCLALALLDLVPVLSGKPGPRGLVGAAFFLILALGLFRGNMWARNVMLVLLAFAPLIPLALFSPMAQMDMRHAGRQLSTTYMWTVTAIFMVVDAAVLYVLEKYKASFHRRWL